MIDAARPPAQRGGPAAPRRLIPFLLTSTDCPYVPA